jgi:hypothetical protein
LNDTIKFTIQADYVPWLFGAVVLILWYILMAVVIRKYGCSPGSVDNRCPYMSTLTWVASPIIMVTEGAISLIDGTVVGLGRGLCWVTLKTWYGVGHHLLGGTHCKHGARHMRCALCVRHHPTT